ncbi:hypothetical protein HMSSN036_57530 [Paenibacillus macerans]|nr:hypothetical protein HMSSN036_57530 [Paenibacillus macerans]
MSNAELKEMLQFVINESLQPVKDDIRSVKDEIQLLKTGQEELRLITSAIRDRQEETDAKLEALSMDVNHMHGDLVRIEQKLDENESELRGDVRFLNHRIADLEMKVEKLKNGNANRQGNCSGVLCSGEKHKDKKRRYSGDIRPFERNSGDLCRYFLESPRNARVRPFIGK